MHHINCQGARLELSTLPRRTVVPSLGLRKLMVAALSGVALIASQDAVVLAQADEFYKGKTINVFIGSAPGAGYDIYSRLVIRHLGNHIPGNPLVVARNMPGGSSRTAAAHVSNVA